MKISTFLAVLLAFCVAHADSNNPIDDDKTRSKYCKEIHAQIHHLKYMTGPQQDGWLERCQAGKTSSKWFNRNMARGHAALDAGYYTIARKHYLSAAIQNPFAPEPIANLAVVYAKAKTGGQKTERAALIQMKRLAEYYPDNLIAHEGIDVIKDQLPYTKSKMEFIQKYDL